MTTASADTPQFDSPGLAFNKPGNPKLVVGVTGVRHRNAYMSSYEETGHYPHYTIDIDEAEVLSHVPSDRACTMFPASNVVAPHRRSHSTWVLINRNAGDVLTPEETEMVNEMILSLIETVGCKTQSVTFPVSARDALNNEMALDEWEQYSGVVPVSVVPNSLWHSALPWKATSGLFEIEAPKNEEPAAVSSFGDFKGRPIALGSSGKKVSTLRDAFNLGPGLFDVELEDLVKAAQRQFMLEADGIVDADTWAALDSIHTGTD